MGNFKFKNGETAVFKGCAGTTNAYTSSGNGSLRVGQKVIITSGFTQSAYIGQPNAYYIQNSETFANHGWVLESELTEDEYTKSSLLEKIKQLENDKDKIETEITDLHGIIDILKENDLEKITTQELKIVKVLRVVDTSTSLIEKMKAISEILK